VLSSSPLSRVRQRAKAGHKESDIDFVGADGSAFRVVLRQSIHNVMDFSAILAHSPKSSTQVLRLRRYNGKSHEHTNKIERQTFYDFHIHMATERYQLSGLREDAYAEVTSRYADLRGAFACMLEDCGFNPISSSDSQQWLF